MARLCNKNELYKYECGDYLLWKEKRALDHLIPCTIGHPIEKIYINSPNKDYFYAGGWELIQTYNKNWRIWERKPTDRERLMEGWDNEK